MPTTMDSDIGKGAYTVVRDLLAVKKGESVLITIDSAGHWRMAEETASFALDAMPGKQLAHRLFDPPRKKHHRTPAQFNLPCAVQTTATSEQRTTIRARRMS